MNEIVSSTALESSVRHRAPAIPFGSNHFINFEIEYLRAVAILLVVLLHAHALFANSSRTVSVLFQHVGSHTGVDLFFCISGYVISRSFQPFFDQHRHDGRWWSAALAFWVRRIFRLLPSAWLWLFIGVALSWVFAPSDWFGSVEGNIKSAGLVMLNAANFAVAANALTGNAVYWTLALEDQFYFVFPFFLFFIPAAWRLKALVLLIVLQVIPDRSMAAHPFLWFTRVDALMWGCLLYQFSRTDRYWRVEPTFCRNRRAALLTNAVIIFLLVAVAIVHRSPVWRFLNWRPDAIVALICFAFVLLASYERGYVLPLSERMKSALAWIGSRSYAIYLIHIPLYGFARETWIKIAGEDQPHALYNTYCAVLVVVLLPVLAELNYRFVETPLRRKGKQLAKQIMTGASVY